MPHTRGPIMIQDCAEHGTHLWANRDGDPRAFYLGVASAIQVNTEDALANATLWAAAPDLLAACQAVLNLRDNYTVKGEPCKYLLDQVREAIARAEAR